jgi:hypothetical protein
LAGIVHVLIVGLDLLTVKLAVFDPEPKSKELSCIAVTVAGVPSVPEENVTTRWFVGTLTFTYEMVPGKYSTPVLIQLPIVTGPLPITFAPTANDELYDEPATIVPISDSERILL